MATISEFSIKSNIEPLRRDEFIIISSFDDGLTLYRFSIVQEIQGEPIQIIIKRIFE